MLCCSRITRDHSRAPTPRHLRRWLTNSPMAGVEANSLYTQTSSRMTPRLMPEARLTGAPMNQVGEQSFHPILLPPTTRWLTTPSRQQPTTNTRARVRVQRCSDPYSSPTKHPSRKGRHWDCSAIQCADSYECRDLNRYRFPIADWRIRIPPM